ncbi:MAG: glycerol-3-phosphate dehydrogenase/oxidase [Anaerolineales bacterium]|nr:glycerol-3-phosphate dehydrogenase/oxidase [Anaerolineales bacterium]
MRRQLTPVNRQAALDAIRQQPRKTVLIVGAGINGIGVYRDLALQGIDVLLVERGDFGSGASAGSSHMVHGGLRYLENGEFRLVREALRERNLLLQNAPHYVKPLPTTIPIFSWMSGWLNAPLKFLRLLDKPTERGALVIKIGLTFYDLFTRGQQTLPRHRFFLRKKSLAQRPDLNPDILCTATYYDAWMPYPERICMELILDTELAAPQAQAINYLSVVGAEGDTVSLRDELSGETLTVQPQIVINAAGPWIDVANSAMQRKTEFIGGTKGSHLVLDHPDLYYATRGHELFFENQDGRICLFFPFEGKVLVGTTDIPVDDPDQAFCTEEEVDYLLGMIKHVFPSIHVDRSHIVFRFCGVRPLPNSKTSTTGQISRDHSTELVDANSTIHFPIYSLVGGKWTTFRAFAEQVTDTVLKRLGKPRQLSTEQLAIGGGRQYPKSEADQRLWIAALQRKTGLPEAHLKVLFERYGTRAEAIAEFMVAGEDAPLQTLPDYSQRELRFLIEQEQVVHLDDLLLRRTLIAMVGQVTPAVLEELHTLYADCWGADEVTRTTALFRKNHQIL